MKKIGITGGIGSGKTTICKIFESLDIPVYYADDRAKALIIEDVTLVKNIKNLLGEESYLSDGSYNRKYVANIVFNDAEKLKQLNALVHPAVAKDTILWQRSQVSVPYTLKEAALIVETGGHHALDFLITVWAPKAIRIDRVVRRDDISREAVEARINKQMPEIEKLKTAHFVIINDGKNSLVQQVAKLHRRFSR